jgi:hypothetical protein
MRGTATHLPTDVDWVLWDGSNFQEVVDFVHEHLIGGEVSWQSRRGAGEQTGFLVLHTQKGDRWPQIGDRIVRGLENELWMISPSLWAKLYGNVVTTGG